MIQRRSRYELLTQIASGGMATVYLGKMHGSGTFSRLVAIKKPHSFVIANARLRKQLRYEARVASLLHHPNVVAVLDVDESGGEVALIMEYVDGCTLKDLMNHAEASGERADRVIIRILLDAAAGLHAAHCLRDPRGKLLEVVHRDVSPQNVLVGRDGIARLADFGIAKLAGLERETTGSDGLLGKVSYLPPEYLVSKQFDARSDLFSLGVVAWEALAQRRLFKGATPFETMRQVINTCPPKLSAIRAELAVLDDVLGLALHADPAQRQSSVAGFSSSLEAAARRMDCVAAHAEVGALVERIAGQAIAERQQALSSVRGIDLQLQSDAARDETATQTLLHTPPGGWRVADAGARGRPNRALPILSAFIALCLSSALVHVFLLGSQPRPAAADRLVSAPKLSSTTRREPPPMSGEMPARVLEARPSALPSRNGFAPSERPARRPPSAPSKQKSALPSAQPSKTQPPDATQARTLFPDRAPPNPYAL